MKKDLYEFSLERPDTPENRKKGYRYYNDPKLGRVTEAKKGSQAEKESKKDFDFLFNFIESLGK